MRLGPPRRELKDDVSAKLARLLAVAGACLQAERDAWVEVRALESEAERLEALEHQFNELMEVQEAALLVDLDELERATQKASFSSVDDPELSENLKALKKAVGVFAKKVNIFVDHNLEAIASFPRSAQKAESLSERAELLAGATEERFKPMAKAMERFNDAVAALAAEYRHKVEIQQQAETLDDPAFDWTGFSKLDRELARYFFDDETLSFEFTEPEFADTFEFDVAGTLSKGLPVKLDDLFNAEDLQGWRKLASV